MNQKLLYREFLCICSHINNAFNIQPVLYGSLWLAMLTNLDLKSQDIDMLIPKIYIDLKWKKFKTVINGLAYNLVDLHEHEFHKSNFKIAFSFEEDLKDYAWIDYTKLEIVNEWESFYKQLSLEDYLKAYTKSLTDWYRKTKNNWKDFDKIEIIKKLL